MATPTGGEAARAREAGAGGFAAQGGLVKATCELSFRNQKIILRQLLNQWVRYILLCLWPKSLYQQTELTF